MCLTTVTRSAWDLPTVFFMQFGAGARVCVGKYLAISELVTALAIIGRLVSSIDMDPDDSTRVVTLVKGHPTGIPTILHPRL